MIVESTTGAAHGRTTRKRMNHLPAEVADEEGEKIAAPTTTSTWEAMVKISVFRSAFGSSSSDQAVVKLSKPTQFPLSDPPIASVMLR